MAGTSPNSTNIGLVASGVATTTSIIVHPEFHYWRVDWQKLRDVIAGQREIKRKAKLYLRGLPEQDKDAYDLYLEKATFYNMTNQTLNGMLGAVFGRDPILRNLPTKFKDKIRLSFGKDGSGHINFTKTVISEMLSMGRFGVLVDAPETPSIEPTSYATGYSAENIMDWSVNEVNGTYQVTRVLLREFERQTAGTPPVVATNAKTYKQRAMELVQSTEYSAAYTYRTTYRELILEPQEDGSLVYKQNIYLDGMGRQPFTIVPTVRGTPLPFIPFMFFGATSNAADVEKSPLLDIAELNISHYRTYAELEWGRMWTALPVYYAPGRDDDGTSGYSIGPSVVWEVPADCTPPGILEYKGQGLGALVTALQGKEAQIAAIGGRLMPGVTAKGSESPEQAKRAQSNEHALLLNAILAGSFGMSQVVRWWLMWRDVSLESTENFEYEINRDFDAGSADARLMRAVQMLHDDGKLPIEVIYNIIIKAGLLNAEVTLDEYKTMLADPANFPNNPDIEARQRGFSSRQQELDQATVAREADFQQQELDLEERQVVLEENAPPPVVKAPTASGAVINKPGGPRAPKPGKAAGKVNKPSGSGK